MTRPALELLFARAGQSRAFLLLAAGGMALGGLLALAGAIHRRSPLAGAAADGLCALLAAAMAAGTAFLTGDGLRGYAFLGMAIGACLYRAGLHPLLRGGWRAGQGLWRKLFRRKGSLRQE